MAGTVAGGLFNAVAFAGAEFLFSKLNHSGYEKEINRHNEAMEKLQKDKDAWYEKTVEKRNKLMQLEDDIKKVDKDLDTTNKYLTQFKKVSEELKEEKKAKIIELLQTVERNATLCKHLFRLDGRRSRWVGFLPSLKV